MPSNLAIARALAAAFLAGALDVDASVDRAARILGRRWRGLRPLARRAAEAFKEPSRPRVAAITEFILRDHGFLRAREEHDVQLTEWLAAPAEMNPVAAAKSWNLPKITTPGVLADWLGIGLGELAWFADVRHLAYKQNRSRLGHYHYRPLTKRFGRFRLIEAPKPRLKTIQRRILTEILQPIPPHAAAHGFRCGRSIKTFAGSHVGKAVVLRIDLEDFFPSLSAARVRALFRTAGYPECVAVLLAGICTNTTSLNVWDDVVFPAGGRQGDHARRLYRLPHLPQGAPTSPALANLCAYALDCRLAGLAHSAGAAYTRYADDRAPGNVCAR